MADGLDYQHELLTLENVVKALKAVKVPNHYGQEEKRLENVLSNYLYEHFGGNVCTQYSVGGTLGLKVDIDLGNGFIGIELKLLKNLTAVNIQRLLGQLFYYRMRRYQQNLICCIAGPIGADRDTMLIELREFIESQQIQFIYMPILKRGDKGE